jgi:hypothetical protein
MGIFGMGGKFHGMIQIESNGLLILQKDNVHSYASASQRLKNYKNERRKQ